jgi:hypothetical protein
LAAGSLSSSADETGHASSTAPSSSLLHSACLVDSCYGSVPSLPQLSSSSSSSSFTAAATTAPSAFQLPFSFQSWKNFIVNDSAAAAASNPVSWNSLPSVNEDDTIQRFHASSLHDLLFKAFEQPAPFPEQLR